MNHFHLLLGALPSLNGLKNYIQTEGGNGATIILVIFAIVFFFKQQIGKFFGFLIFAGVIFFAIGNPTSIISAIKSVWNMVV